MKILIQTLDFSPRQELLDLVNEKLSKLEKFSDRIVECRVVLRVEKSDTRENKFVEVRVVIPGNDLFFKKSFATFEEGVQKATETLQRQVKEWKAKVQSP